MDFSRRLKQACDESPIIPEHGTRTGSGVEVLIKRSPKGRYTLGGVELRQLRNPAEET